MEDDRRPYYVYMNSMSFIYQIKTTQPCARPRITVTPILCLLAVRFYWSKELTRATIMETRTRDLRGIIEGLSAEELRALLSGLEGRVVDVGE